MPRPTVEVQGEIHRVTQKAILFSDDGDRDNAVWLPVSQLEEDEFEEGVATITIPEWLAQQEGLI